MCEATPVLSAGRGYARAGLAAALAILGAAGAAEAQTMGAGSSQFNGGYSSAGVLNQPINVSTRDENNNQLFINGVMQAPAGSVFSNTSGFSQSTSGGVGGSGVATAIGNNLNVVVQGSWNRVVIDSTQINNGQVTANASLNGQIKLDGQ